ncbi:MAG TPA: carbohydrate-binding protein [Verrucomicrobiae bacterium]
MPLQTQFRLPFLLLILGAFIASAEAGTTRNPLNIIAADSFDRQSGNLKLEAGKDGVTNLCFIHEGDYAVYKAYDFDSGVAGFKAKIASPNNGSIEIRLGGLKGKLLGNCPFASTGDWQKWSEVACQVDNSQAGVRDVYLIFHGPKKGAILNLKSFAFLKSIVVGELPATSGWPDRTDSVDAEPRSINAWGMPASGFADNFESGRLDNWTVNGLVITTNISGEKYSIASLGTNFNFAYTPKIYINPADTGGEWRTLAEGALTAEIRLETRTARPGIGFLSRDGAQEIYAVLNAANNSMEVWRKFSNGSPNLIKQYGYETNTVNPRWLIETGRTYRLQMDWSPYSNGLIVFLKDEKSVTLASFRTVIDLPAARHPLLVCSGGAARFNHIKFDPTLDDWNFSWQWKKEPVLSHDVCNPAVWKWKDGKYYMMWRKFGMDTYHGIASSADGIHWQRINDEILKCRGDMNVLVDPFGDGLVYVTPGGANMPWWSSDGSRNFTDWKDTGLKLGDIFGNSRIQEIIDTKKYPQMAPVSFKDQAYRFIAFTENWTDAPQPHTVILLSNTLTNWVLASPNPLIPPRTDFWGEKGSAIGSALVLPDGNILIASCSCTFAGYTGAPEPSNISAIVDGKQPWKLLKLGILPDAPVSRENVWYQGPNFGTALLYEPKNDTLFFYGGFHDYYVGVMRVQNFSKSKIFGEKGMAKNESF